MFISTLGHGALKPSSSGVAHVLQSFFKASGSILNAKGDRYGLSKERAFPQMSTPTFEGDARKLTARDTLCGEALLRIATVLVCGN